MDVLTQRERECLESLAQGLTNAGIASKLGVAVPTVAMHLASARRRLGAHTREEAVATAVSLGLIKPRHAPQTIPIYLVFTESPDEAHTPAAPTLLDVEQRIVENKLEFEVKDVGFRFVLDGADDIAAVIIRCRGNETTVQPFYRDVSKHLQGAYHATSGSHECECWGSGCLCFPLDRG